MRGNRIGGPASGDLSTGRPPNLNISFQLEAARISQPTESARFEPKCLCLQADMINPWCASRSIPSLRPCVERIGRCFAGEAGQRCCCRHTWPKGREGLHGIRRISSRSHLCSQDRGNPGQQATHPSQRPDSNSILDVHCRIHTANDRSGKGRSLPTERNRLGYLAV